MKTNAFQATIKILAGYFLAFLAVLLPVDLMAMDNNQNLFIQNVELRPGDVINLLGGPGAQVFAGDDYGHTAMYLGIVDGEKKFLDFTTTKGKDVYKGRILSEKNFLSENSEEHRLGHESFDVYRVEYEVAQDKLVKEARAIAKAGIWGLSADCASAVARSLSVATGQNIVALRPDKYAETDQFKPVGMRINIRAAMNEVPGAQISGEWRGSYRYDDRDRTGEVVDFTMSVHQQGSVISGSIRDSEVGSANIYGSFNAETMQIHFTKSYGDNKPQVAYDGAVSGNAAAGRWHIGDYAGSWEMHR